MWGEKEGRERGAGGGTPFAFWSLRIWSLRIWSLRIWSLRIWSLRSQMPIYLESRALRARSLPFALAPNKSTSARTEEAITGVAKTGHDIALVVERAIES